MTEMKCKNCGELKAEILSLNKCLNRALADETKGQQIDTSADTLSVARKLVESATMRAEIATRHLDEQPSMSRERFRQEAVLRIVSMRVCESVAEAIKTSEEITDEVFGKEGGEQ